MRQNAGSSLLEAAVMLLVGFYFFATPAAEPGWGIGDYAAATVVWTFRGGGLLMLGISLLCWMGWGNALLVGAIASGLVGLFFVLSGAVLVADSSLMGALVVLFGLMSLHSARGSWGAHRSVAGPASGAEVVMGASGELPESPVPWQPAETSAEGEALKRLLDRKKGVASEASAGGEPVRDEERSPRCRRGEPREGPPRVDVSGEPPEGFLAELGRDDEQEGT